MLKIDDALRLIRSSTSLEWSVQEQFNVVEVTQNFDFWVPFIEFVLIGIIEFEFLQRYQINIWSILRSEFSEIDCIEKEFGTWPCIHLKNFLLFC